MNACRLAWLLVPLALVGCEEPFTRPGTWHATGVSQNNIDAQVVNKADAVAGSGQPGSDAVLDAKAVKRLYDDKTRTLKIESTTSGISQ